MRRYLSAWRASLLPGELAVRSRVPPSYSPGPAGASYTRRQGARVGGRCPRGGLRVARSSSDARVKLDYPSAVTDASQFFFPSSTTLFFFFFISYIYIRAHRVVLVYNFFFLLVVYAQIL